MMQFYPQREERAGEGPGGRFYLAELTGILPALLEEFAGKVQLIYIDPPFGTGDAFCLRMKQGAADWQGVSASQCLPAYEDTLPLEEYLCLMRSTLVGARELLSEEGAIFLHCDWHRSAHLRLLLDEVFGARNFVNEIIWAYQTGGRSRRHFSRKHDNIFFYRKSKNLFFDAEAVATARGARDNHLKRHVDADGRVYRSVRTAGKVYTYYDDEPVPPSDVWDDVSHMQQRDPRRSGYDGQKPAALLERILKCASREGDLVADLMCGSGAFLSAASALGRRFLGVDQSPRAAAAAMRMLSGAASTFFGTASQEPCALNAEFSTGIADYIFHLCDFDGGLDRVDAWAAGYFLDGAFHAMAEAMRTHKNRGQMDFTLHFPIHMGVPAIRVSDTAGRQLYYRLEE